MFDSKHRYNVFSSFGNQARDNILRYLIDNETGNYLTLEKDDEDKTVITLCSKDGDELSKIRLSLVSPEDVQRITSVELDYDSAKIILHTTDGDIECDISDLVDIISGETEDIAALASRVDDAEDAIIALDTAMSNVNSSINTLNDDVVELEIQANSLQTRLESEITNRTTADTTLQANISAEEASRIATDTTLQNNIDAEETARIAADTNLASTKQDTLVSGTNIKTINDNSILGSGNVSLPIGSIYKTGAELEDMEYEAGQQYYCTQSSEVFIAGNTYLGIGANSIVRYNTTAISNNPEIVSFSITPTTTELGDGKTVSYSYSLKKYRQIHNLAIDGTIIAETPSSASGSGTISGQSFDSHTFTLSADGVSSRTATISPLYRQFYGVIDSLTNPTVSEVLAYLQNITSSTTKIKTYLQNSLPSSVSFDAGSENNPQYAYLIVKDNLVISKLTSNGFDVPYSLLATAQFTNSFNSSYNVRVYRTDSKIFGSVVFNINS